MKSKLKKGLYPISITDVKRYIKNCENWGYGNRDTCKYVTDSVLDNLDINFPELHFREGLYSEILSIVHDINSGSLMKSINIPVKN